MTITYAQAIADAGRALAAAQANLDSRHPRDAAAHSVGVRSGRWTVDEMEARIRAERTPTTRAVA